MAKLSKTIRVILPLMIFLILDVFLWLSLRKNPHKIPSPFINKPMPQFSAASLFSPQQIVTNKNFMGHVSLLNVFATWCITCHAEHPVLMDIKNTHKIRIVGLNFRDDRSKVLPWLKKMGDPYQSVIYDPSGKYFMAMFP